MLYCQHVKKKYLSFNTLQPGEYMVKNFSVVDTQYGRRVRIELDDEYMFSPERFADALPQVFIDDLNQSPKTWFIWGRILMTVTVYY